MDWWGVHRPKRIGERYEALAGDLAQRRTWYLFKRRLGMSIAEARALPWWEFKVYLDGLLWEFSPESEDEFVPDDGESLTGMGFGFSQV